MQIVSKWIKTWTGTFDSFPLELKTQTLETRVATNIYYSEFNGKVNEAIKLLSVINGIPAIVHMTDAL